MKKFTLLLCAVCLMITSYAQDYLKLGDDCYAKSDYDCAVLNYEKALRESQSDKLVASLIEAKLLKAINCTELKKSADQAYKMGYLEVAKDKYKRILEINPEDRDARMSLAKCDKSEEPQELEKMLPTGSSATSENATASASSNESTAASEFPNSFGEVDKNIALDVFPRNADFAQEGGAHSFKVKSKRGVYVIAGLPSWCKIKAQKETWFTIAYEVNTESKDRGGVFSVWAGSEEIMIYINQPGVIKPDAGIAVTTDTLELYHIGGLQVIDVDSTTGDYQVTKLPSWCKVKNKYENTFIISYEANKTNQPRSGSVTISSVQGEAVVNLIQPLPKPPFNSPSEIHTWGVTAGYILTDDDNEGIQVGVKMEPLYRYGFGWNTGATFEAYAPSCLFGMVGNNWFSHYAINIPIHGEYRAYITSRISVFGFGGFGLNTVVNSSFNEVDYPVTFEYGGGMRIGQVQINAGQRNIIGDFDDIQQFGKTVKFYHKLTLSLSYMF